MHARCKLKAQGLVPQYRRLAVLLQGDNQRNSASLMSPFHVFRTEPLKKLSGVLYLVQKKRKSLYANRKKNPLVSPLGLFTSPPAYFTFVPSCKFPNNSMYMSYAVARSLSMVSRSVTARPDCFSFTNLSFAVCGIMEVKTLLCQYKTETLPVTANKFKETSNQ